MRLVPLFGVAIALAVVVAATPFLSWALTVVSALSLAVLSLPAWAARGFLLVPLFTRLQRDDLLSDGVRPKIMEILRAEPGLGITDVCARLQIGWGTAVHHLTRLEGAGLLVSQDAGRRRRFFLPSESATRRTAVCVLSSELSRRLLEAIRARPGLSQTELCAALGISAPLAHKYLARLTGEQLVTTERQWRTVRYFPADSALAALTEYAQLRGPEPPQGLGPLP